MTHGRPDIDLSVHTRKFLTQLLEIQLLLGFVVRPASVVVLHPAYSQGLLKWNLDFLCYDFLLDLFACKFTLGDVYVLKLLRTVTFYVM